MLEGICNSHPPLRAFSINLLQSGNLASNNICALEFASALELVLISGLPWGAVVFLDTLSLTEFEEHQLSIEANILDTWIVLLPFAQNLTSMAMWYGDILGVIYGRWSHALLSEVTSFSSGSINVFDAVTLPKLVLLSLSTISEHDDPLILMAAKRMLVRSNTSHTLRGLEFCNITMTGEILSIFDLSPCLDQVTLECDLWTLETDMIIRRLLTVKLAHYDMDRRLTCTPLLSRLRLTIIHQPQPFSISFYNEGLVDMMEVRQPEDPDGCFNLCIVMEDSIQQVTFIPLTSELRLCLCQYHEHGCCLSLTVSGTTDKHITSVCGSSSWWFWSYWLLFGATKYYVMWPAWHWVYCLVTLLLYFYLCFSVHFVNRFFLSFIFLAFFLALKPVLQSRIPRLQIYLSILFSILKYIVSSARTLIW